MNNSMRFGRRLALPSTAEIKHELRLMAAADALRAAIAGQQEGGGAEGDVTINAGDLATACGLTADRAQILIDRFIHAGSERLAADAGALASDDAPHRAEPVTLFGGEHRGSRAPLG